MLIGGTDGVAGVFSNSQRQMTQTLKGGSGSITDGLWAGHRPVIATSSGAVKVFDNGLETGNFTSHAGEATAVALHPSGDILASVGIDKSYVFYDLTSSTPATQVYTNSGMRS